MKNRTKDSFIGFDCSEALFKEICFFENEKANVPCGFRALTFRPSSDSLQSSDICEYVGINMVEEPFRWDFSFRTV
jgi:hypothetical protein